jgi:hypothetical protein
LLVQRALKGLRGDLDFDGAQAQGRTKTIEKAAG